MSGHRKRSGSLSGSGRSGRSSTSGKVATVVSFAVVNVDLDDQNQNLDQSKQTTLMLAENACRGASESISEKSSPYHKPQTMSVAVGTDGPQQLVIQPDIRDSNKIGTNELSRRGRSVSFKSSGHTSTSRNTRSSQKNQPFQTSCCEAHSSSGSSLDSTASSRRSLQEQLDEITSSRRKRRSKPINRSYSRSRRSKSYRSRSRKSNRRRKPRSKLSKRRKSRTSMKDQRSSRSIRSVSRKSRSPQSIREEEAEEAPQPSLKVYICDQRDSANLSTKDKSGSKIESRRSMKEMTPYYTPQTSKYETVLEGEYTPTMESMGVKKCNCEECLKYEERARIQYEQFKKSSTRKMQSTAMQPYGSLRSQRPLLRTSAFRPATKLSEGVKTSTRTEPRRSTKPILPPTSPSGSLHTNFNITLPPSSPYQKYQQKSGMRPAPIKGKREISSFPVVKQTPTLTQPTTSPKPTADRSLTASTSTQKKLTTSTNYNPARDYNPVCDCTNCQAHRAIREADDLCDCYDCISAMRANSMGDKKRIKQKQYKLKDPPIEGHTPQPPRRARTNFPWVKQLIMTQQPDKPYNRIGRKSTECRALDRDYQRHTFGPFRSESKAQRSERSVSSPSDNPPSSANSATRNKPHAPKWSLLVNKAEGPSTKPISQESTTSYSQQTDQTSTSAYKTSETSETRSSYSTDQRGTTQSSAGTMTSSYTNTTPSSYRSTTTTNQTSTQTGESVTSTDDYTNDGSSILDDKKRNKRKPWKA